MRNIVISIAIGIFLCYLPFIKDIKGSYVEGFSWIISSIIKSMGSKVFDLIPAALQNSPGFANPSVINAIGDFTPVVGTTFGFVKTAKRVYKCTSPLEAVKVGVKSVVIDCTPPVIKYPVLCSALFVCAAATFYTGNANLACGAIKCAEIIIEEATGG